MTRITITIKNLKEGTLEKAQPLKALVKPHTHKIEIIFLKDSVQLTPQGSLAILLQVLFKDFYECLPACMPAACVCRACRGEKAALDLLGWELQKL